MTQHHDISRLEKQVTTLSDALAHLSNVEDFKRILILKKPGWTTPAEFAFATSIVESMLAHTAALTTLKQGVLRGSEAVAATH